MSKQSNRIVVITGGYRYGGKTEKMKKLSEKAINEGKLIILPNAPSIVIKDTDE